MAAIPSREVTTAQVAAVTFGFYSDAEVQSTASIMGKVLLLHLVCLLKSQPLLGSSSAFQ